MKNLLLLFLFFTSLNLSAQCEPCEIDFTNTELLSPLPCPSLIDEDTCGFDGPAIIGLDYEFVFDVYAPFEIALAEGTDPVEFNSLELETEGAFLNLPEGVEYYCNPPSCIFEQDTHGCVKLCGKPTESNPVGVLDVRVLFKANLLANQLVISDTFPGALFPGHYWLDVVIDVKNIHVTPFEVEVIPNPANEKIQVDIDSEQSNDLNIEILDFTGKVVKSQSVKVGTGNNFFDLNVSDLIPGIYLYSVGNNEGVLTDRILIARN